MANNGTIYYIYFDKSTDTSSFLMIAEGSYVPNPSKLLVGWASYGDPVAKFNIFNAAVPDNIISGQVIQGGTIRTTAGDIAGSNHGIVMTGGKMTINSDGGTGVGT